MACVDAPGDGVEVVLGVDGQVGALGQPAAQQPVEVLVHRALPGGVGISEVDLGAKTLFDLLPQHHLSALIPGEGTPACLGDRAKQADHALGHVLGVVALG